MAIYRDYKKGKSSASYLALRIAVGLESFGCACANEISETEDALRELGMADARKLPTAPGYPTDDDGWRVLDQKLAERALTLPNRIASSQYDLDCLVEEAPFDVYAKVCREFCVE